MFFFTFTKTINHERYFEYIIFVLSYMKKTQYLLNVGIIFTISLILESCDRIILYKLIKIDDEDDENKHYYLFFFCFLLLCKNIYDKFKTKMERSNEIRLEIVFEKDTLLQISNIPYQERQKMDMKKLEGLKEEVCTDLKVMMDSILTSYLNIFIQLFIASYVFYEKNMIPLFSVICISGLFFFYSIIYPLNKKNVKRREKTLDDIRQKRKDLNLLKFYFEPFPEKEDYFNTLCKKTIEIFNLDIELGFIYKEPIQLFEYFVLSVIVCVLISNYIRDLNNYYLLISTLKSLFDTCSLMVYDIIHMEEFIDRYNEFSKSFLLNTSNQKYKLSDNLALPLHIKLDNKYIIQGEVSINEGDHIFITGPSGVGKSSLAKKIAGYDYYRENEEIYRKNIYYLTQDFQSTWSNSSYTWNDLFPNKKDMDEIKDFLSYFSFPLSKIKNTDTIYSEIPMLSGGEKKRLQYAFLFNRDIKHHHQILILDELNMSLDKTTTENLILGIQKLYPSKVLMIVQHEKPSSSNFTTWKEFRVLPSGKLSIF